MSTCVEKLPCPDCNSSDSIQTYLNIDSALGMEFYTSFCHGECWENKGDPYGSRQAPKVEVKTQAQIQSEANDIQECKIFEPSQAYRGIPASYFRSWGCRTLLSEFDGRTPYAIGFPMSDYGRLVGWKARVFKYKSNYGIARTANTDPFGFERAMQIGGNTLFITEGEFDAIALDYCLALANNCAKRYPVVSLTHGGGSLEKNFLYIESRIRHIKYIVLVVDDDPVGKKAERTALAMWPKRVTIVRKPKGCKDANDAVQNGKAVEMGKLALNFNKSK